MVEQSEFIQQVNLYPEDMRPHIDWLSPSRMAVYVGGMIGFLCFISSVSFWFLSEARTGYEGAVLRKDTAELALSDFIASESKPRIDKTLGRRIKNARDSLALKRRVLSLLEKNKMGYLGGYSSFFEGLARRHVKGLWLKDIKIVGGGEQIVLGGEAVNPKVLPEYLDELKYEEVFVGKRFDVLKFFRSESNSKSIEFVLATSRDIEKESLFDIGLSNTLQISEDESWN